MRKRCIEPKNLFHKNQKSDKDRIIMENLKVVISAKQTFNCPHCKTDSVLDKFEADHMFIGMMLSCDHCNQLAQVKEIETKNKEK